jgi:prepilin-type processing-associated H-X9-DG protein
MDYNQAQQRVKDLKKFYKSVLWFGIVAFIIFFDDIFEKGIFNFSFWDGSVLLAIWGIGKAFYAGFRMGKRGDRKRDGKIKTAGQILKTVNFVYFYPEF